MQISTPIEHQDGENSEDPLEEEKSFSCPTKCSFSLHTEEGVNLFVRFEVIIYAPKLKRGAFLM